MLILKKNPKIPLYYIVGKYRYWAYFSKYFKWLLRSEIKSSINELNNHLINRECYNNASCKDCGCQVPQQNYGGKPCECFWINSQGSLRHQRHPKYIAEVTKAHRKKLKEIYEETLTMDLEVKTFFKNESTKPGGVIGKELTKLEPETINIKDFEINKDCILGVAHSTIQTTSLKFENNSIIELIQKTKTKEDEIPNSK